MTEKLSPEKFSRWDSADYLKTEEDIDLYFELCLQEDPGDGSLIRRALGSIARARGMSQLARGTGLTPADTAHQRTERVGESPHPSPLPAGEGERAGARDGDAAIIPAGLSGDTKQSSGGCWR